MTCLAPSGVRLNPTKGTFVLKKKLMGFAAAFAVAGLIVAAPMAANAEEVTTPDTSTTAPDQTTVETPSSSEPSESVDPPAASEEVTTPDAPDTSTTAPDQTTVETASSSEPNDAWVPGSTSTAVPTSCSVNGAPVSVSLLTDFAAGEIITERYFDDVRLPADSQIEAGPGTHRYAYVVYNLHSHESVRVIGEPFTVEACATPQSPIGPTIDEPKQAVTIPEDPNFTYAVEGGSELQPGVHVLGPVGAGSIIATPKPGVSVSPDATTQWPFIFAVQPPKTVTPPALVPIGDHLPIPSADGVVYTGPGGTIVTGTVTLPDGQEQCFDAVPMGDIKITPGAVTHWCFTYQKPSTDNPGGNTGGPGTDTGAGTNGGSTGAGTATTGSGVANPVSNTAVSAERRASESTDTLALTGSSMPIGVPLGAAGAVLAGIVLMLARRSKQVI